MRIKVVVIRRELSARADYRLLLPNEFAATQELFYQLCQRAPKKTCM